MTQQLTQERITVGEIGKWGVRVGADWYSLDKKSGLSPAHFVPNQVYDVSIAVSTTGKKYIHQLLAAYAASPSAAPAPAPVAAPVAPAAALPPLPQALPPVAPVAALPAPVPVAARKKSDDPVVRGQVRMHAIIGALQSPAGHVFAATPAEYDAWVQRAADLICNYTFEGN